MYFIDIYVVTALLIFGGSYLISNATITSPIRDFLAKKYYKNAFYRWSWIFLSCQICTSFWVAGFLGLWYPMYSLTNIFILDAIAGCAFTNLMITIQKKLHQTPPRTGCNCSKNNQQ